MGNESTTKDGHECQMWSEQTPHKHKEMLEFFPQYRDAENYCRNAGGDQSHPWCYTTDPKIKWQKCSIPSCGKMSANISSLNYKVVLSWNVCVVFFADNDEIDMAEMEKVLVKSKTDLILEIIQEPTSIMALGTVAGFLLIGLCAIFLTCRRNKRHLGYDMTNNRV